MLTECEQTARWKLQIDLWQISGNLRRWCCHTWVDRADRVCWSLLPSEVWVSRFNRNERNIKTPHNPFQELMLVGLMASLRHLKQRKLGRIGLSQSHCLPLAEQKGEGGKSKTESQLSQPFSWGNYVPEALTLLWKEALAYSCALLLWWHHCFLREAALQDKRCKDPQRRTWQSKVIWKVSRVRRQSVWDWARAHLKPDSECSHATLWEWQVRRPCW